MVKKLIRGKLEQNLLIGPLAGAINKSPCTGWNKIIYIVSEGKQDYLSVTWVFSDFWL